VELPIFPLNTVLFPGTRLPLHIFEERYKIMIGRCREENTPFGVCLIKSGVEVGGSADPFAIGTTAHIADVQELDGGRLNVICLGGERFRIHEIIQHAPHVVAKADIVALPPEETPEALVADATNLFSEYIRLNLAAANQWARNIELPTEANALADFIGGRLGIEPRARQRLLEELSATLRLQAEVNVMRPALQQLQQRVEVARAARWQGFGILN
jgi:hypothetical protein